MKHNLSLHEHNVIQEFNNGSDAAFEYLYKKFHAFIYLISVRLLHSDQDARDARSTVFLRLLERRDKVKFDNYAACYGWVRTTARNVCLDKLRHTQLSKTKEDKFINALYTESREIFEATDKEAALLNYLFDKVEELPPHIGQVFKMRVFEELKFIEIAKALGQKIDTVKKRYSRAVELIRRSLYFITLFI